MTTTTTGGGIAPDPNMPLRALTFGDWLDCGDVSRLVRLATPQGEEAVEFRTNEDAVARWMKRATGLDDRAIADLPLSVGRAIYVRLAAQTPAFAYAKPLSTDPIVERNGAIEIELSVPISGHRDNHSRLFFRPPTFGDAIDCGDVSVTRVLQSATAGALPATEEVISADSVGRWFARLSGLSLTLLRQMTYSDAFASFGHLRRRIEEIAHPNFGARPSSSG